MTSEQQKKMSELNTSIIGDECDTNEQIVTTVEVCGESLVASRNTIFLAAPENESSTNHEESSSPNPFRKMFTRGSVILGPVIHHDAALISCFRDLTIRVIPEGDRIVFACEIRGGTSERFFFVIVSSKRGANGTEESMILIASIGKNETDENESKLVMGIPILSTTSIEFRGRGIFGVSLLPWSDPDSKENTTLYFETKSLHSMWAAIVSLEKARDQAKANNVFESDMTSLQRPYWVLHYFPLDEQKSVVLRKMTRNNSSGTDSTLGDGYDVVDPEEEGEGGSAIVIGSSASSASITAAATRAIPAYSFSSFGGRGNAPNVGIFESEPGIGLRLFSLTALKSSASRKMTMATLPRLQRRFNKYEKPDLDRVNATIYEFVSTAQDPDDLSVSDVIDHLKGMFGLQIIGRLGYSSAMIDGLIYTVVGQMEPPSQICDKLFLGSEYNAANKAELKRLGISHILNVTVEVNKFFPDDFKYHQVCVLDTPQANIFPYFERGVEFIELGVKNGACLVHCQRGVSRSASFVIAYLMKSQNASTEDAIKLVKQKRRIIKPNTGFVKQLKEWERVLTAD